MITKSVSEARRKLSELIELARRGEDVVIIKDSRPVATIRPVDASQMELLTEISNQQAQRLWEIAAAEPGKTFRSPSAAVAYLKRRSARHR